MIPVHQLRHDATPVHARVQAMIPVLPLDNKDDYYYKLSPFSVNCKAGHKQWNHPGSAQDREEPDVDSRWNFG